ncbi:uncharacterized protein DS421_19g660620 [Arachis hypogaea]|uniref:Uncharacterized protein n=1 Tax=Arachis hypogaea TaxID=3818 RepID=A0A6B9VAY0_ARAHY|nr:uncharacterized protein DS421_19g660620 [Arachis hypogaea]
MVTVKKCGLKCQNLNITTVTIEIMTIGLWLRENRPRRKNRDHRSKTVTIDLWSPFSLAMHRPFFVVRYDEVEAEVEVEAETEIKIEVKVEIQEQDDKAHYEYLSKKSYFAGK